MSHGIRARAAAAAGLSAALLALTLAACSSAHPGAAAVVGDTVIEESTVAAQLRSVNGILGLPPDTPSAAVTRTAVSYDVGAALVEEAAERFRVTVEPSTLEQAYQQQVAALGGETALFSMAAQRGIAPEMIKRDLLTQMRVSQIAEVVAPGKQPEQQQQALFKALVQVAGDIGVDVSPRYGQWNPQTLQITDPTNPVSSPEATPSPVVPAP